MLLNRLTNPRVSLLQRISVRNVKTKREFVLTADFSYTINEHGDQTTQTVIPSFSAVLCKIGQASKVCMIVGILLLQFDDADGSYQARLKFIVAPMRTVDISTYLPYDAVEHDAENGGVMLSTITSADIIDTHFLMPIFGLKNMWPDLSHLPEAGTYNTRNKTRGYFSLPYGRFDVASSSWAMSASTYSTALASDQDPRSKVFVTEAFLKTSQTSFGFDEEVDEITLLGNRRFDDDDGDDEGSDGEDGASDSDSRSAAEGDSGTSDSESD